MDRQGETCTVEDMTFCDDMLAPLQPDRCAAQAGTAAGGVVEAMSKRSPSVCSAGDELHVLTGAR